MKIPKGHNVIMPYLIIDGASAFTDFVKQVFNAELIYEAKKKDGNAGHCEVQIGGNTIMFTNSNGQWTPRTADMFVYVAGSMN